MRPFQKATFRLKVVSWYTSHVAVMGLTQRFRGGLVFKAHRLVHHSTLERVYHSTLVSLNSRHTHTHTERERERGHHRRTEKALRIGGGPASGMANPHSPQPRTPNPHNPNPPNPQPPTGITRRAEMNRLSRNTVG